jgi:hypothetical protein
MKKALLTNPAFRYIFEVFVIVFSVSISFAIQEFLNDREKIELKNKGLNGILKDLKEDKEFFTTASRVLTNRIKTSETFLDGRVSNKSLNQIMLTYGFVGQNTNYKSLVSTGVIEFINENSLSKELANYYEMRYSMLEDISGQYKELYLEFLSFMRHGYPVESIQNINLVDDKIDFNSFSKITSFNYKPSTLNNLNLDFKFRNHLYDLRKIKIYYAEFFEAAINQNSKLSFLIHNEIK